MRRAPRRPQSQNHICNICHVTQAVLSEWSRCRTRPRRKFRKPAPPPLPRRPQREQPPGRLPVAAQLAGDGDQAGAAAHRAGRPADRRTGHRDSRRRQRAGAAGRLYRQQSGAQHRSQERRRVQPRQQRRLPDVAGRHAGVREHRQLHRRSQVRSRRVHRHADLPRLGVRAQRRSAVAGPHPADHARSSARPPCTATSGAKFDPNSKFTRQPAVGR